MTQLLHDLPPLAASHLELTLAALAVAIATSLPLAIATHARPRVAAAILAVAAVVQTIPGLALLALMVPVLAWTRLVSPFGFAPAVIALILYAILPIVRNAIIGLRGVDPAVVDAARGLGLTERQIVRIVKLPLAMPVIAAGIRTATVWTLGAATLATPVGQPCLGNYIFAGLQTRNFAMLLTGVVASAALALVLDVLLGATERRLTSREHGRRWLPGALLVGFAAVVLLLPRIVRDTETVQTTASTAAPHANTDTVDRIRLGAKTFTEQYILVELMRTRLLAAGVAVDVASGLGSTVVFDALVSGELDAYVDYAGTLWANEMKRGAAVPRWQLLAEVSAWLANEHGVRALPPIGFENTYALAMRRERAAALGVHTLTDVANVAHELAIGGDYEFFGRGEWTAVQRKYDLHFGRQVTFDPTLLYDAVVRGDVDVISAYSSDGRIAADDLVVLDDPKSALPAYDAMVLLGSRVANDARIACVLGELRIAIADMRLANAMVDRDHATPSEAAAWLARRLPPTGCAMVTAPP
jgi:osmoprotectant transport system permease protein